MKIIKRKFKLILLLTVIALAFSLVGLKVYLNKDKFNIFPKENSNPLQELEEIEKESPKEGSEEEKKEEVVTKVNVDIKGAIKKPGVYELNSDQKVIDVVNLAGGFSEDADSTLVNLAKKVTDEMVVIIYTKTQIKKAKTEDTLSLKANDICVCPTIQNDACLTNDSTNSKSNNNNSNSSSKNNAATNSSQSEKVNINTASLEELQSLNGIGEGKAKSIIEYREQNGNFQSIEEIQKVNGIGESIYAKIKDHITI